MASALPDPRAGEIDRPRKIFAYVPGLTGTEAEWQPLVQRLRRDLGGEWKALEHRCGPFSRKSPWEVARQISAQLDDLCGDGSGVALTLIGHSIGGVLVRAAYLMALGKLGSGPIQYNWPGSVTRFVLLASIDRGIHPTGSTRARWGLRVLRLLRPFGVRLVRELIRGSEFITNVRISWMRYYRALPEPPLVVQIFGTEDDEVMRADCMDQEQFPYATALEVPGGNHVDLHKLDSTPDPELHYRRLHRAISDEFQRTGVDPQGQEKQQVVMLLHGIRASAMEWPDRLREEIKRRNAAAIVRCPSYGYFTALRFAVPFLHRKPLRWFYDEYSQLLAMYPTAEFAFVGHSNGTYLMAQSIAAIPSMVFERAFLGGCVLPQIYPWEQRRGQVKDIVNAFSHSDAIVGWICSALAGIGRRDVGTAGFEGFHSLEPSEQLTVKAGHGAAFDTAGDLASVADYILTGNRPEGRAMPVPGGKRRVSRAFRALGFVILGLLVALPVILPFWGLVIDGVLIAVIVIFLEML